jgi:hypothetical protein
VCINSVGGYAWVYIHIYVDGNASAYMCVPVSYLCKCICASAVVMAYALVGSYMYIRVYLCAHGYLYVCRGCVCANR